MCKYYAAENYIDLFYFTFKEISGKTHTREQPFLLNPDAKLAIDGVQLMAEHFKDEEESFKVWYGIGIIRIS